MKTNINLKKALIVAAVCLFAGNLFAQDNQATLNINLQDVRSIKVNAAQRTVDLNFATAADYMDGVSTKESSHLEITSTGNYQIQVKAATANLVNGTNTIPVNTITLTPVVSTGSTDPGDLTLSPVSLSDTDQPFIKSPESGSPQIFFDVEYKASGGDDYIGKPEGTYTTTVTYDISPA